MIRSDSNHIRFSRRRRYYSVSLRFSVPGYGSDRFPSPTYTYVYRSVPAVQTPCLGPMLLETSSQQTITCNWSMYQQPDKPAHPISFQYFPVYNYSFPLPHPQRSKLASTQNSFPVKMTCCPKTTSSPSLPQTYYFLNDSCLKHSCE